MATRPVLLGPPLPGARGLPFLALALAGAVVVGGLASLSPLYAVALVLAAGLVLLVATNVQALPLFLVLTMFVESLSLGPGLRIGRLAAVMAIVVVALYLLQRGWRGLRLNGLIVAAAAYGALMLASVYWAADPYYVYDTLFRYALALAYMFAFAVLIRSARNLRAIFVTLAVGSLVFGAAAFATFAATASRAESLQGDHNFFASYQVVALAPALVLAAGALGWRRALYFCVVAVVGLSVVATLSRGGLVALGVVVLATLVTPARLLFGSVREKVTYVLALAAAGAIGVVAGSATFIERVQSIVNTDPGGDRGSGRLDLWRAALEGFREEPVLGLGAGNFQAKALDLLHETPGVDISRNYVEAGRVTHSIYLETLTELGVVGVLVFMLLMGLTGWYFARSARRALRARDATLARFATALLVSFIGLSVAGVFLSNQLSKPLWILIGLALALDVMTRPYAGAGGEARAPVYDEVEVREELLEARERRLREQLEALEVERKRLRRREAMLATRETRAREGDADDRLEGDLTEDAEVSQNELLTRRERELARHHSELTRRSGALKEQEAALEEARAELDERARRLAGAQASLTAERREVERLRGPGPAEVEPGETLPWTLDRLERLVSSTRDRDPQRADEWAYYLFFLRDHADVDGRLPAQFDSLVWEVFGELLERPTG